MMSSSIRKIIHYVWSKIALYDKTKIISELRRQKLILKINNLVENRKSTQYFIQAKQETSLFWVPESRRKAHALYFENQLREGVIGKGEKEAEKC